MFELYNYWCVPGKSTAYQNENWNMFWANGYFFFKIVDFLKLRANCLFRNKFSHYCLCNLLQLKIHGIWVSLISNIQIMVTTNVLWMDLIWYKWIDWLLQVLFIYMFFIILRKKRLSIKRRLIFLIHMYLNDYVSII